MKRVEPLTLNDVENRPCIICGKEMTLIYPEFWKDGNKAESAMWSGGIVGRINANYGSTFDSDMFIIAICDKCVEKNLNKLVYLGNYMGLDLLPHLNK